MPSSEDTPLLAAGGSARKKPLLLAPLPPPAGASSPPRAAAPALPPPLPPPPSLFDRASLALLACCGLAWCGFAAWQFYLIATAHARDSFAALAPRLALVFMLTSLPLSLYDVAHHVARYQHPIQRLYVRILLLPPIYSIESYVAVIAPPHVQFAVETLRECYECVALLAVFHLACETLGRQRDIVAILNEGPEAYAVRRRAEAAAAAAGAAPSPARGSEPAAEEEPEYLSRTERVMLALLDGSFFSWAAPARGRGSSAPPRAPDSVPTARLIVPFCCCGRWKLGASFLNRCRFGVAQYVLVRVVCSVVFVSLESLGMAGDGLGSWRSADLYIYIVINASQLWALYCLVFFASVLWPALLPLRPINKFLLVKLVVFGLWWQSVMLETLDSAHGLDRLADGSGSGTFYANVVLQDVLITVEVMLIAVCHHYVFGVEDFLRPEMQAALAGAGARRAAAARRGSSGGSGGAAAAAALAAAAAAEEEGGGGGSGRRSRAPSSPSGAEPARAAGAQEGGGEGGAGAAGAAAPGVAPEGSGSGGGGGGPLDTPDSRASAGILTDLLMLDVATDTARVIRNSGSAVGSMVMAVARTLASPAGSSGRGRRGGAPPLSDEGFYVADAEEPGSHI
jgi:hypothetical protein